MFNIFSIKNITIFILYFSLFGCNSSETNAKTSKKDVKVIDCSIDFDDVDFCDDNRLKIFKDIIQNKKYNFDKNKNIYNFEYNGFEYVVVIDINNSKVFPLEASIKPVKKNYLHFNLDSKELCLDGDFNQFQNSYRNVRSCFNFINNEFHLTSRNDLNEIKMESVKAINLPNSSNSYSKCRDVKSEKECKKESILNDYTYTSDKVDQILDKLNLKKKVSHINANGFKFIEKNGVLEYLIAEKYVDTDESSTSEFFLIKIDEKNDIISLGDYYSIDNYGLLKYGKNNKIKLF